MELTPETVLAVLTLLAFLLYIFAWWATTNLPRAAKVIVRLMLALVMLAPLGLGLTFQVHKQEAPSSERGKTAWRKLDRPAGQYRPYARPPSSFNGTSRSVQPPAAGSRSDAEVPPAAEALPEAAPAEEPSAGALPPEPSPPAESEHWDVVPVFYGTDRARDPAAKAIDYSSGRGKRLQLGHVLVTVPKSHQVPQIERPWVYHLPFTRIVIWQESEDPKKHFTIKEIRELGREEFLELVRKRLSESKAYENHAIVFVHGFNTSFQFAVFRTAQIAYDLKFDGAPFLYSWPSKGQLGLSDYSYDRESAGAAEPYFREFLELVVRETGAKSVSVIAHSMGNQLLLPVLRDMKRSAPEGVRVAQVILAAPDVDRDAFEFLAKEIQGISDGITLFAAANDRALTVSREFWGGVPRAGDVPPEGPIIVPGVDTIDVTAIHTELFSLNHSGYAEKTELLNDIQLLIQTGERPPEKRVPIIQRVTTSRGEFWRYPSLR